MTGLERRPVSADPMRLRQVVDNLLSNAITYNRDGGTVFLGTTTDGTSSWILVRDTGVGISEADRSRLFQRYYKAGAPRSTGTGLGLAITRDIVRAHGGDLGAAQLAGRGLHLHRQAPRAGRIRHRPPEGTPRDPRPRQRAGDDRARRQRQRHPLHRRDAAAARRGAGRVWALAFLAGDAHDARLHRVGAVARRVVGHRRRQCRVRRAAPDACGSDAAASTAGGWRGRRRSSSPRSRWPRRSPSRPRARRRRLGGSAVDVRPAPRASPAPARWSACAAHCGESRTAWVLAAVLGFQSLYYVSRTTAFLTSGPDSALFQSAFGTVTHELPHGDAHDRRRRRDLGPAGDAGADARLPAPDRRRDAATDGILAEDVFAATLARHLCERASRRSELVGVIAVRIDELDQISTAFGSDVARAVSEAWRTGVRRHAPSNALVADDGPTGLLVGVLVDSPQARATRRRGDLSRALRGSRQGRRGSDPGRRESASGSATRAATTQPRSSGSRARRPAARARRASRRRCSSDDDE